ncbi:4'-phosphopantetheinyl transferase psf-1 [Botrimarina colliarenosi]|uniref:4'-phosphopantetheinyl transferase psf-1 n=1 Tax=Botrimarina colliarenosi TaxID=2528001 RepID=A0A5C6AMB8_9BACT|nr:4'-phosphopantetheinyl transferase superfamily protein [Botrimarina colliarenosi]TWU00419.1 4'-phosphopantetheinyl transferase psf-1 [Botrimarina colliarenosi]
MHPTSTGPPASPPCRVLTWRLDADSQRVAQAQQLLSEEERARATAFSREDVRRRFVLGRGELRRSLGELAGAPPQTLAFCYGKAGKPALVGDGSLHFNLAHTGDLAICAIAGEPVGVDVERVRPMKNALGLAERWFHPEEVARLAAATDPLAAFFGVWTMKEAALKLVGLGVGESLPRTLTPADPRGGWVTGLPANELGIEACWVTPLEIDSAHAAALATAIETSPPTLIPQAPNLTPC